MVSIKRTGAEVIIDAMQQQEVEYIFGLPGGNVIPLYDALVDSPIQLVLTRHEQGAVHMADGYARASGKTGVVLVTSGPGATNVITGLFTAHMDSVPLVVVCGQQLTSNLGMDAFQEADISGISYPVVKHSYLIKDPQDIPRILKEAFHLANSGRPGPVLVDIPKNVSSALIDPNQTDDFHLPGYIVPKEGSPEAIETAAVLLEQAERPVIICGQGVILSGAEKQLLYLAEKMRIPVAATLLGKGGFPETHELSLGMPGMHGTAYANMALNNCDLVMAVGSRWDDRIVGNAAKFCPRAKKIHIDIDPAEINKIIKPVLHHRRRKNRSGKPKWNSPPGSHRKLGQTGKQTQKKLPPAVQKRRQTQSPACYRRSLPPYRRQSHSNHRRRPASNVGRPVLQNRLSPALDILRRGRNNGLRPSLGNRGPNRRTGKNRHSDCRRRRFSDDSL
jgi:acetolactate synthase-1/2/3 large subunit